MLNGPISFPDWRQVLAQAGLPAEAERQFEREIILFLRHCKVRHSPATTSLAQEYLGERERQTNSPARQALRWFFRLGRVSRARRSLPRRA